MNNSKEIIGIIGGAGVAATNKLALMVEELCTRSGAFRDAHHPEMVIYQAVSVPSRSMYLEGRGETFVPGFIDIAKKLKSVGSTEIGMSCNTAHYAIDEIEAAAQIPFINMVRESVLVAKGIGCKKVGLMASDGCRIGKVYERYFSEAFPLAEIVYPSKQMQAEVTRGIVNIKNTSRFLPDTHPDRPKAIFSKVCHHLVDSGVEVIISGCTDIAVDFLPADFNRVKVIDSLEVLAEIIVSKYFTKPV